MLCSDATLQRVLDMHSAPWFRAYSLLQRCCPRLELTTYVEQCTSLVEPAQQLVRPPTWTCLCGAASEPLPTAAVERLDAPSISRLNGVDGLTVSGCRRHGKDQPAEPGHGSAQKPHMLTTD